MTNHKKYTTFNPDVTLQEIAEMYRDLFVGKVFHFDVAHKDTPIRIKFDEGHLKHLLGLHYLYPTRGKQFRPESMYHDMLDGSLTLEMLEKKNPQKYRKGLLRIQCFQLLPELLKQGICGEGTAQGDMRNIKFFIYDEALGRYIYLGIMKEKTSEFYVPATFVEDKSKRARYADRKQAPIKGVTIYDQNSVLDQ